MQLSTTVGPNRVALPMQRPPLMLRRRLNLYQLNRVRAGKFFLQMAVYIIFLMTSESIGLLVSILARTATNSVVLLTLVLLLLLSFSGFLTAQVKPYFKWCVALITPARNGLLVPTLVTSLHALTASPAVALQQCVEACTWVG